MGEGAFILCDLAAGPSYWGVGGSELVWGAKCVYAATFFSASFFKTLSFLAISCLFGFLDFGFRLFSFLAVDFSLSLSLHRHKIQPFILDM